MPRREDVRYKVVVNHEEQYRLVREDRSAPVGFHDAGRKGSMPEMREAIRELLAELRHDRREQNIEELLEEEDRTEATTDEHVPR